MDTPHSQQIGRIKKKLLEAKTIDKDCLVFGASAHKYAMHSPATISQVESFEATYGIQLPECYRAFKLHVGNGGTSYQNSGAGPYYGIYTLGDHLDTLVYEDPKIFLKNNCCLYPKMKDAQWKKLTKILDEDGLSDEVYYEEFTKIYGGILPLGTQGCTYVHGLLLNGPHKGKVVNLEMSADQKPFFAPDTTFLDWYERWLDEIISGKLIKKSPSWFGYTQ
ncbi:SMI1/KNR4 family protein [Muricauda sp. CAU 1633]|uniref:SMI1/KNR4 family protein n=1 Tax=Allomuricauda sp. CAU 1633 TaxID=2816036 RepID=UPI001A8FDC43|nr:SMI1/KNR4 family protein [Muricauda sp. CAU 1633]MBO0321188.1 SMI1/KNR4 family protein [Muricauda sp. CAU 1633]